MYIESGYFHKTVPFSSQYCFSCFHKLQVSIVTLDCIDIICIIYCQMFITIQYPIVYYVATQNPIVNLYFSSCGNSIPGHSTKFVTLPSSILLYEF